MKKELPSAIPLDQESQSPLRRTLSFQVADNLFASFRYAWAGVSYAFVTQRNFRIHTLIGSIALGLGVYLKLPSVELAVVGLTSGLVLVMELLNTALEAVVDLTVQQTYHELAKIAKDCAAASVLISALAAVIVAGLLLLPPLWAVLSATMG
ncbi:MAG: diacylglycerol kinase family protein [Cyanobacteria bacterium P01_A01_bin.17]